MASRSNQRVAVVLLAMFVVNAAFPVLVAEPAGAHGVDITADLGDEVVELELTDETGEVCVRLESSPDGKVEIAPTGAEETVLDLGAGFGRDEQCQTLDVETVNAVLANVGGYDLILTRSDGTAIRAPLRKPLPPVSETALADNAEPVEDDGLNVPLIFTVGACLGVALVVLRKRFS